MQTKVDGLGDLQKNIYLGITRRPGDLRAVYCVPNKKDPLKTIVIAKHNKNIVLVLQVLISKPS